MFRKFFKQFRKNRSIYILNIVGLSIIFSSLLLSTGYIQRELSYDRHHINADRIVRLSLQFDYEPIDGRIWGNDLDDILRQMPEVNSVVKMFKIHTAVLTYRGNHHIINNFYSVTSEFLNVFTVPLVWGDKNKALQRQGQILISESFAQQLFGNSDFREMYEPEILIDGQNFFVSGIFKDIPESSHFHTDILLYRSDDKEAYTYTYLLLNSEEDINGLAQEITNIIEQKKTFQPLKTDVIAMPLTDIHLHSHNLREMNINGNINYIYLILGGNGLLLIVVLFNLWLNKSLILSFNRRYYQILRLHGAQSSVLIKDEAMLSFLLGVLSIIIGLLITYYISSFGFILVQINTIEIVGLCLTFLSLIIVVSLIPAIKNISHTLFLNTNSDMRPIRFSYSNIKWMLIIQFAVTTLVMILAFGIKKQMDLMKKMQVGGSERSILVMPEQPEQVIANYDILKEELLKHTGIEAITTAFQLPGDAIRDGTQVKRIEDPDWKQLPTLIVGDDFLPFFNIELIAGQGFSNTKYDYQTEETILLERLRYQKYSEHVEEYVINRKALSVLGYKTSDEAIGEMLQIAHNTIDYFQRGIIVGVTDDFNYTGLYEDVTPMIMIQRRMFQHCIMIEFTQNNLKQGRSEFEKVWTKINPDYPPNYFFMSDLFRQTYHNEISAQWLIYIFSLLCFIIADLGLVIFMSYIIQVRIREIAIRKLHGANIGEIILMLNMDFIRYIGLSFVIALPLAWYVLHSWLERFAYQISLGWWLFMLVILFILLISFLSVSLQSWRAAKANPVNGILQS